MEWDKEAADEFVKIPMAKRAKENTKVLVEKLARKNHSDRVTLKEIAETKKLIYKDVPEEKRQRDIEKRIAEGEKDLRQRIEEEGREILARDIDLFNIELCTGETSSCRNRIIELAALKEAVAQKLRGCRVSEIVADLHRDDERIMPHHRFIVSISGCPNGCTGPEAKPFGVHGVSRPMVTDVPCSECFICADRCLRGAIIIKDGGPAINRDLCDMCENCVKGCTTGTLASEKKGYRIMVGGMVGRFHQFGAELFKIVDKDTLMAALEASIKTLRDEARGYENLTKITNRVGVAPIFQRMR
ncbi:MAG: hypothetical protein C4555_00635 [Dehalococcoidia bacterium]|nr:MAG: hypothetical protein C4555_00635 [Dehalococcoidia bacterium]